MFAVATGATRRHWVALRLCRTVQAGALLPGRTPVTGTAVDRLQVFSVAPSPRTRKILVTLDAGKVGMHGGCHDLRVHVHRDLFVAPIPGHLGVIVTPVTSFVFLGLGRAERRPQ